jgi:hypothetical protein
MQTVKLVIFLSIFNALCMCLNIWWDGMKSFWVRTKQDLTLWKYSRLDSLSNLNKLQSIGIIPSLDWAEMNEPLRILQTKCNPDIFPEWLVIQRLHLTLIFHSYFKCFAQHQQLQVMFRLSTEHSLGPSRNYLLLLDFSCIIIYVMTL